MGVAWLGTAAALRAHEIPNDVTIQTFLKPEGRTLRMLVRVPLIALRDMTWPFRAPDVLDLNRAGSELTDGATLWLGDEATMYEGTRPLASPRVVVARATLPSDRSFDSYDQALALLNGPRAADTDEITVKEGFLDVLFEYPIESDRSRFSFAPRWGRLGIQALTIVRLVLPDGGERRFDLQGDPGLVHLDPTWLQSVRYFLGQGLRHVLSTPEYLLLVGCLLIPWRRRSELLPALATIVAAHSITLVASAYGLAPDPLWFPVLIATLVAAAIVYVAVVNVAVENVSDRNGTWPGPKTRRPTVTIVGLIAGFSFWFTLQHVLQFAGAHWLTSVLAFDLGAALGLALAAGVLSLLLAALFRTTMPTRLGVIVLSVLCAHAGWHWTSIRFLLLSQYQFIWPDLTAAFFVSVVRWLMIGVGAAALWWLAGTLTARRAEN
jgi:hypothetical protein